MRFRSRVLESDDCLTGVRMNRCDNWNCPEDEKNITEATTPEDDFVKYESSEQMWDVVTPLYHRLSAKGHIINSPMEKIVTITRDNPCTKHTAHGKMQFSAACDPDGYKQYLNENWFSDISSIDQMEGVSLPTIPSYDSESLIAEAVNKAWAHVDVTDMQSLVTIGEGKKTVVSMISIAKRLIKIMKMIKRLDVKGLSKFAQKRARKNFLFELTPKQLSERYMELRYALRPLLYDARNVSKAIATQFGQDKTDRLTFRGHKSYDDGETGHDTERITYITDNCGVWDYDRHDEWEWRHQISVRAGVLTHLKQMNTLNIWGLTQPVESMWELCPFSFVVDWFFNVGETLAAFTPNYGIESLASWYTVVDTKYQRQSRYNDNFSQPVGESAYCTDFAQTLGGCWTDKTVITTTRVPNPSRQVIPTFSLKLDIFKLTDLVIIARGIFFSR